MSAIRIPFPRAKFKLTIKEKVVPEMMVIDQEAPEVEDPAEEVVDLDLVVSEEASEVEKEEEVSVVDSEAAEVADPDTTMMKRNTTEDLLEEKGSTIKTTKKDPEDPLEDNTRRTSKRDPEEAEVADLTEGTTTDKRDKKGPREETGMKDPEMKDPEMKDPEMIDPDKRDPTEKEKVVIDLEEVVTDLNTGIRRKDLTDKIDKVVTETDLPSEVVKEEVPEVVKEALVVLVVLEEAVPEMKTIDD
jgi:protein phosphatase 1E